MMRKLSPLTLTHMCFAMLTGSQFQMQLIQNLGFSGSNCSSLALFNFASEKMAVVMEFHLHDA